MMTLKCMIVDDEPLARKLLRSMLAEHPDIEVIAECEDGEEAIIAVRRHEPDVVFLDVQMPRKTGIEVLQELGRVRDTEIVFVTAYDQYALQAFEANAVDYLLKPFDEERLAQTLERVRARIIRPDAEGSAHRLAALLESLGAPSQYLDRIAVKRGETIYLKEVDEIELFHAEGKYVRIHTGGEQYIIRETMLQLDQMLDPRRFMRVSRSDIINISSIRTIQPWFRGDFAVTLKSGQVVNTTKSYRDNLKRLIDRVG